MRVGRVLSRPLAIRGGVSAGHSGCDTPGCQKAPSAIRCIKTENRARITNPGNPGQKAPSAIRCIKTGPAVVVTAGGARRQKAPSAIRCIKTNIGFDFHPVDETKVRKHRAP